MIEFIVKVWMYFWVFMALAVWGFYLGKYPETVDEFPGKTMGLCLFSLFAWPLMIGNL